MAKPIRRRYGLAGESARLPLGAGVQERRIGRFQERLTIVPEGDTREYVLRSLVAFP